MNIKDSIDRILEDSTFLSVFSSSFSCFLPSKRRFVFIITLGTMLFSFLSYSKITGENLNNIFDYSNTIILALLALLVTGYSIFQALSSTESLITFFSAEDKKKSVCLFIEYQRNFFSLSIIYIILICLNYIILFMIKALKENPIDYICFHILSTSYISEIIVNIITDFLLCTYFMVVLNSIIELKSFIYGLYQAFNIASIAKILNKGNDK